MMGEKGDEIANESVLLHIELRFYQNRGQKTVKMNSQSLKVCS